MVVHSLIDVSMYRGTKIGQRYLDAGTAEERLDVLLEMSDARVQFIEAPEGEELFPQTPEWYLAHLAELDLHE